MADRRWALLTAASPSLMREFSGDGVVRIDFVAAFPAQSGFAVWLCTSTDHEATQLRAHPALISRATATLAEAGFAAPELHDLVVTVQSQETVDRDYSGSWFNALR